MIKVGDRLPAVKLHEFNEVESEGCALGPVDVDVAQATAGRKIVVFGLPGAYTPTCSARHVPGLCRRRRRPSVTPASTRSGACR